MVVDAEDGLSLEGAHGLGDGLILLKGEVDAVVFGLPVRRIEIEEGVRTVVLADAGLPVEVFDAGIGGLPS